MNDAEYIQLVNQGYLGIILLSVVTILSALAILALASCRKQHFFTRKETSWAYTALVFTVIMSALFIYNIIRWIDFRYEEVPDVEFHFRWFIYHSITKIVFSGFHLWLALRVVQWRKKVLGEVNVTRTNND